MDVNAVPQLSRGSQSLCVKGSSRVYGSHDEHDQSLRRYHWSSIHRSCRLRQQGSVLHRLCFQPMGEQAASLRDLDSGNTCAHNRLCPISRHVAVPHVDTAWLTTPHPAALAGAFPHVLTADRLPPPPPLSIPTPPAPAMQQPHAGTGPSRMGPLSWDPAVLALLASGNSAQLPPFLAALTQQQPPLAPPHSLPDTVPLTVSVPQGPYQPSVPSALHLLAASNAQRAAETSRAEVKPEPMAGSTAHDVEDPRASSPPLRTSGAPAAPAVPTLTAPKPSNRTSYLEKNRMAQVCHLMLSRNRISIERVDYYPCHQAFWDVAICCFATAECRCTAALDECGCCF